MAKKVPTLDPKDCELGYYWDSISFQTWIDDNISNYRLKSLLEVASRSVFGADPCEMSFLFFLWYTNQSQSFENLINANNGLQEKKTKLGTQHFSKFLATKIE
jgi:monoamine oxidase